VFPLHGGQGRSPVEFIEVERGAKITASAALPPLRRSQAPRRLVTPSLTPGAHRPFISGLMNSDVIRRRGHASANASNSHPGRRRRARAPRCFPAHEGRQSLAAATARGTKLGNPPRRRRRSGSDRQAAKPTPGTKRRKVLKLMTDWKGQGRGLRAIYRELNRLIFRHPKAASGMPAR